MPDRYDRTDWRDRDPRDREDYRDREAREETRRARDDDPLEDYGQADFSREYAYDPDRRTGYRLDPKEEARRRYEEENLTERDRLDGDPRYDDRYETRPRPEARPEERSWAERSGLAGMFGGGAARSDRRSNDRVLWAVAAEALHKARGIDDRDIHVHVEDAVVTLEGTVRNREEKRRAEDLVDQRGVRDVRNHLQIRERRFF